MFRCMVWAVAVAGLAAGGVLACPGDAGVPSEPQQPPVVPPPVTPAGGHLEEAEGTPPAVPPGLRETSPRGVIEKNGYISIQVNVDENGDNILNDAANEPSIAVDPTNPSRIAIGWRQFDTITDPFRQAGYGYTTNGGYTWTFPGVLEPGIFRSDPVLDADAEGNFYYNSLTSDASGFWCKVFRSSDGGATWDDGVFAQGGDKQWMAIDRTGGVGRGNIYSYWTQAFSICAPGHFTRSYDGGDTYVACEEVLANPFWGTLTVGPDGDLYITGNGFVVLGSSTVQDQVLGLQWDAGGFVDLDGTLVSSAGPNPGGLLGQAWVATDHSTGPHRGTIYVCASVNRFSAADPCDVMFSRSTDGGFTWSSPVRVNDDAGDTGAWQWFGTMSVAPNGRIDVIWNDTRNDPGGYDSELRYSFSEDAGATWSPSEVLSPPFDPHLGWPQQNKLGDYYDMVSDDIGAHVAYAATFNGEQDVYYLRIGETDCNSNGVHDACDVDCGPPGGYCDVEGCGESEDCNSNYIPDECEPDEDCQPNGIQDICDIADGTSQDCQPDGVPDECNIAEGTSQDCNTNGVPDECDIDSGDSGDCNTNGVPDECDIADGVSLDCQPNGIPDECEPDCNTNGVADDCDIADGVSLDCQPDAVPDECQLAGPEASLGRDACPDAEPACTGIVYTGSITEATADGADSCTWYGAAPDKWYHFTPRHSAELTVSLCDSSYNTVLSVHSGCPGTPANTLECNIYACGQQSELTMAVTAGETYWIRIAGLYGETGDYVLELSGPPCEHLGDCNTNGIPDDCDLADGTSLDCQPNGVPDECETDCNTNGIPDDCDLAGGTSLDCQPNGVPDECDLADGTSADCNTNGTPDECDIDSGDSQDCNRNGLPDECDISSGASADGDGNGVPDECEAPILFVDAQATGQGFGTTWTDAYPDLQEALTLVAKPGIAATEIWVAAGTYTPAEPAGDRAASFVLLDGLSLIGGFAGGETSREQSDPLAHPTVLSGDLNGDDTSGGGQTDNAYHVVTVEEAPGGVLLDGFIITGGNASAGTSPHNSGAGVYARLAVVTLRRCHLLGNGAAFGGGVCGNHSELLLVNCLLAGNTAEFGGAMFNDKSDTDLVNCTLGYNTGEYVGGGVYSSSGSQINPWSSILWGNSAAGGQGLAAQIKGGAIQANYCCVQGLSGSLGGVGNIGDDPLFVAAGAAPDGDFHLRPTSPCIDTGDPAGDFGLEPEPDGGRVNMGCYGNTPQAATKGWLSLIGYQLVGKQRVDRTVFDYTLRIKVTNEGEVPLEDVVAELLGVPENVEIIESEVVVGDLGAGATKTSGDTFTIRVDRTTLIAPLWISWDVSYVRDGEDVDGSVGGTLAVDVLGALPGDYDADGDVDLVDFAAWGSCVGGPGQAAGTPCGAFDADQDQDVDLADFADFQAGFTG